MPASPENTDSLDIAALRNKTPGCQYVTHFNNAGASLPEQSTVDVIESYLRRESIIGGYEAALESSDQLDAVYDSVARLINSDRNEIALMNSATDAWNTIFYSLNFNPGDQILTSSGEYASNYMAILQQAHRNDLKVSVIPDNDNGEIDIEKLKDILDDTVRLVALTHIPTNNGLVNPAQEVGEIVKDFDAYYLLDACQSVGQIPIDVEALQCDFLTGTGRKYLRGPRGTGFLYIRKSHLDNIEPSQLDIRSAKWIAIDEYELEDSAIRFERWEHSHALRLGLKNAVDIAWQLGLENIESRITKLADHLREQLATIPGVVIRDKGVRQCGIVTFDVKCVLSEHVVSALRGYSINTSVSPASMARLDMEPRGLEAVIRASLHYYNTETEIDNFLKALKSIVKNN